MKRRKFLQLLGSAAVGMTVPKLPQIGYALEDSPYIEYVESGEFSSLVFTDIIAFYTNAPGIHTDGGKVPGTNESFYSRKKEHNEFFGFCDEPRFLVLHTDGGTDIVSSRNTLERRNVFCQFFAGDVEGTATSIQCSYLGHNRININGTAKAGTQNPFVANIQYWSSLHIEMQGSPNEVREDIVQKALDLILKLMVTYKIPISRLVGHHEIPNNYKPDPGRILLSEIRTRIYQSLWSMGYYSLLDVRKEADLARAFDVGDNWDLPASVNEQGEARCWLDSAELFVDWSEVRHLSFMETSLRTPQIQVFNRPFVESYLGSPAFVDWVHLPRKPLSDERFQVYQPNALYAFVAKYMEAISDNKSLVSRVLPLSYLEIQNLAILFIEARAYERRGEGISEVIVAFSTEKDVTASLIRINDAYFARFGERLS